MPISVHVRAADPDHPELNQAVEKVFSHLRRVDAVFSTWSPDSELMRIRRGALSPRLADPWFGRVAELARTAELVTGGLFSTDLIAPDGSRGWDPTGLVKGWGVARAAEFLRAAPCAAFAINAAGDIVCGPGAEPVDEPQVWRIGIENPRRPGRIDRVVPLTDAALATSGNAARGAHIVDPRTGLPVRRDESVSVVGPDLCWADIWATAAFVEPAALSERGAPSAYRLI